MILICLRTRARLALAAARHQFLDGFAGRFPVMKDSVHLFGDGHFHPARMGEPDGGGRGEDSFGNHAVHAGNDVGEIFSTAEFYANAAISRQSASAGEHEITQTSQARHGFGTASASHDEAGALPPAARGERSAGSVTGA